MVYYWLLHFKKKKDSDWKVESAFYPLL
jgi:hypothetical protein